VESGQSKEFYGLNVGTMGLPKALKGYGSRGIVVPLTLFKGRILGQTLRNYCSDAGNSSTVKTDATFKLLRLGRICLDNPNYIIGDSLYKLMYNPRLYEIAYNNLKSKAGNRTPGINPTSLDGFSSDTIAKIIDSLKNQTFNFNPGKRIKIPKASGVSRHLTIAPTRDKVVLEVIRMILEVIFEPTLSNSNHAFRKGKSCHTALKEIRTKFGVSSWYIVGDISKCFYSFDHDLLISFLRNKMKDERFIRIIIKALKAGYFEFRVDNHSILGTPQGSIISHILCNIYLDNFDKFVDQMKQSFSKESKTRTNPRGGCYYNKKRLCHTIAEKRKGQKLQKQMLSVQSKDLTDPNFKNLLYVRYADDWIIGIRGSLEDCKTILVQLRVFLKDNLKLSLSENKTLITNARQGKANFLGTRINRARQSTRQHTRQPTRQPTRHPTRHPTRQPTRHPTLNFSLGSCARRINREIRLEVPLDRIHKKLNEVGFMKDRTPVPRFIWMHYSKDQIISMYNSVYSGYLNYYSFAMNKHQLSSYLHFVLKTSCAKLLAAKFTLKSQSKVYLELGKDLKGTDKIGFIVAEYGLTPWDFKTPSKYRYSQNKVDESGIINTL
jgi:group II intron reverse transcriptase/maturase